MKQKQKMSHLYKLRDKVIETLLILKPRLHQFLNIFLPCKDWIGDQPINEFESELRHGCSVVVEHVVPHKPEFVDGGLGDELAQSGRTSVVSCTNPRNQSCPSVEEKGSKT